MFDTFMAIGSVEALDRLSVNLMDEDALRKLQEEMASRDIAFLRADYWPADVLTRRTKNSAAIKRAIGGIQEEPAEQRMLHLLQMISSISPGASDGIQRFLRRVTFG